jgi:hypothetical protein
MRRREFIKRISAQMAVLKAAGCERVYAEKRSAPRRRTGPFSVASNPAVEW